MILQLGVTTSNTFPGKFEFENNKVKFVAKLQVFKKHLTELMQTMYIFTYLCNQY